MKNTSVGHTDFSETEIICRGEGDGATDIQCCVGSKENAGWVHQEQIRVAESFGLNSAKNAGWIPAGHPAEDIRCRKSSFVQEVGDVAGRDVEVAEAVKQIESPIRSCSTDDIELDLSPDSNRSANLGAQTGRGDGRDLGVGFGQGNGQQHTCRYNAENQVSGPLTVTSGVTASCPRNGNQWMWSVRTVPHHDIHHTPVYPYS